MGHQSSENSEQNGTQEKSGVDAILKERGSTYGDSGTNLKLMQDMLDVYNAARHMARANMTDEQRELMDRRPNAQAHDAAIIMIIGKLARIATGIPHADNYDDTIGYTKIARKHAIKE